MEKGIYFSYWFSLLLTYQSKQTFVFKFVLFIIKEPTHLYRLFLL
nr:MAG TPA: hypothetical protein [Caudoviricetes sp.]DAS91435.1 MAG TPA: hypothetical protein [Caudoviricetes sp.]